MAMKPTPKSTDSQSSPANKPVSGPATKAKVYAELAAKTGLTQTDIAKVFSELSVLIGEELGKKGPGVFVIPGLSKLKVVRRPATKAKQGINPFTKEPMTFKAKPARSVIRASPVKALSAGLGGDVTTPPKR